MASMRLFRMDAVVWPFAASTWSTREREGVPLLGEPWSRGRLPRRHHRDDAEQRARAGDFSATRVREEPRPSFFGNAPGGLSRRSPTPPTVGMSDVDSLIALGYTLERVDCAPSAERIRKRSVR